MIDIQNAVSLWAVTVFRVPFMVLKLCILDMSYICYSGLLIALKIAKKAGHSVSHCPLRMKIQGKHKENRWNRYY